MKVKELKPADYNPRVISEARLKMLKKSLDEFGDLSGVVFNVETGQLVGGHQRLKHLDPEWKIVREKHSDKTGTVALGYIETPSGRLMYREVKWTSSKEIQANIAANNHGGEFDKTALVRLFRKMDKKTDENLLGFRKDFFKLAEEEKAPQLKDGFEVVVECADEASLRSTYEKFQQEGYKCRILIF